MKSLRFPLQFLFMSAAVLLSLAMPERGFSYQSDEELISLGYTLTEQEGPIIEEPSNYPGAQGSYITYRDRWDNLTTYAWTQRYRLFNFQYGENGTNAILLNYWDIDMGWDYYYGSRILRKADFPPSEIGGKPVTAWNRTFWHLNFYGDCLPTNDFIIPKNVTSLYMTFGGCTNLNSVTFLGRITNIGVDAFQGCSALKEVTIPGSVKYIGEYAFEGCSALKEVTIPGSVTNIGGSAFGSCTNLTNATISNGVTSIGDGAFYNCTKLTSVTIPESVTNIGNWAFWSCTNLTVVTWTNGVKSIGSGAFAYTRLTNVTIPGSVTNIGDDAFSNCTNLTNATISNGVTSIGNGAFKGCTSLTSVTIPGSVTNIGASAFEGCTNLKYVTLPNVDMSIGDNAFRFDPSITNPPVFPVSRNFVVSAIGDKAMTYINAHSTRLGLRYDNVIFITPLLPNKISFPALPGVTYSNGLTTNLGAVASSGLMVSYTTPSTNVISISSNKVTILGAGTATIVASQGGNSFYMAATPVTNTLVIGKAIPSFSFASNSLSWSYTGSNAVVGVTNAGSVPYVVTYNGLTNAPTGAGTYTVVARVADTNNYLDYAVTNKLVIAKSVAAVAITGTNVTYSGTGKSVIVTTTPAGLSNQVTYNAVTNLPTNAGSYPVVASVTDANYAGGGTATLTIAKASNVINFAPLVGLTYSNGLTTNLGASASNGLVVSYTTPSTNAISISSNVVTILGAGTATIVASQSGDSNYLAATPVTNTLVIGKALPSFSFASNSLSWSYTGSNAAAGVTNAGSVPYMVTYNGLTNAPTGAGTYTVVARVADTNNYLDYAVTNTLVIAKSVAAVAITGTNVTYSGTGKSVIVTTTPAGLSNQVTYNAVTNLPTNAGSYPVVASVTDANYAGGGTATLTIAKASNVINFAPLVGLTYSNGLTTNLGASASNGLVVSYTTPSTNAISISSNVVTILGAGTATIVASQSGDSNYLAATPVTNTLVIVKGSNAITFGSLPSVAVGSLPFSLTATSFSGLPVSYSSGSSNIALKGNLLTVLGAGTATITASQTGNTNWNAATNVIRTLVVTGATSSTTSTNSTTNRIIGIGLTNTIPTIPVRPSTFPLARPTNFGKVVAWGNGTYGQTNIPAGLTNVVQLSTRGLHNLALKTNGKITAWGWNAYGQTNVPAVATNIVQVAAGVSFSTALRANGTVVAWGNNILAQTNVPAGLTNVVQIAAGSDHAVALRKDGTVTAWGWNAYGQTNVPANATNVVQVAAGYLHSVALRANGTVVAWGDNTYGETNIPAGLTNVVRIVTGLNHTVALRKDGTVAVWGWNNAGQTNRPAGLTGVAQIASGGNTVFAVTTNGTLVTWGDNSYGQRKPPAGVTGIHQFVLGLYHALGLKK